MQIAAWHWLVFGVILIIAEMFVPTFFLLWFGTAGVVVAGLAWLFKLSFTISVLIWVVLSVVFCALWFRLIQPHIKNHTQAGLGAGVIIGEIGMITKVPSIEMAGNVRFTTPKAGASEWACRSQDATPLAVGDRVMVVKIVGNELLVSKK